MGVCEEEAEKIVPWAPHHFEKHTNTWQSECSMRVDPDRKAKVKTKGERNYASKMQNAVELSADDS